MNLKPFLPKSRIRRAFDRAVDSYAGAARVQAAAAKACAAMVPEGDYPEILEIGAGGGVLTKVAALQFEHDRYTCVDLSEAMLEQVDTSRLNAPRFIVADGEHLNFPPKSFDLLLSSSAMQWYQTPVESIPANLNLVHEGGRFSLAMFVQGTLVEMAEAAQETGFGSVLPMRPPEDYLEAVTRAKPQAMHFHLVRHATFAPDARAMLRAHRATGATAAPGQVRPSKAAYLDFLDYCETHFREEKGIRTSAHILHVWGTR